MAPQLRAAQPPERVTTLREAGFAAFSGHARTLVDAGDALGKRFYMAYGSSEAQALVAHQRPTRRPRSARVRAGRPCIPPPTCGCAPPRRATTRSSRRASRASWRSRPKRDDRLPGRRRGSGDAFTDDGYLRSGDLGSLAEGGGFVYLTRQRDVLRLGGFLVSPVEIEDFLDKLEPVGAAQVVGVETPSGATPVAFVIGPSQHVDEEWIIRRCEADPAKFKVPRRVVLRRRVPDNAERQRRTRPAPGCAAAQPS